MNTACVGQYEYRHGGHGQRIQAAYVNLLGAEDQLLEFSLGLPHNLTDNEEKVQRGKRLDEFNSDPNGIGLFTRRLAPIAEISIYVWRANDVYSGAGLRLPCVHTYGDVNVYRALRCG